MAHSHSHTNIESKNNLKIAFFLNLFFCIVELIGGIYVNSVAIISDAIHDLGDSLSLGTAWYLQNKSEKEANDSFTYGYKRFSLLGALINSFVLIVGSIFVVMEAIRRLETPESSDPKGMFWLAVIGIAINGYAASRISKGSSLNEKVVSLHLMEDVLGWVAVLVVSIILYFKNIPYLDPILSLLITAYILVGTFKRLKETLYLFLQGVPENVDFETLKDALLSLRYIDRIDKIHLWSLEGEHHVFSAQFFLSEKLDITSEKDLKEKIHEILHEYNVVDSTLEFHFSEN